MKVIQNLVPASKYAIKCPYSMTPQFVVIHNTANDASAEAEISYMIRNDNEVSYHYAVDDLGVVQGIPENRNGWHAGDGGNGKGNRYGIAIEICYSKSGGPKFEAAERNAAALTADILRRHGWGVNKVFKHQDFSGKYCPHRTLDRGWSRYLDMVKAALSAGSASGQARELAVGDTVTVKPSATTYATDQCIPDWVKGKTDTVAQIDGDRVLLKGIYSWVRRADIKE